MVKFKKGCQPGNKFAKDEEGDLKNFQYLFNRWKNFFCLPLNEHDVSGIRQTEIHATEKTVPKFSNFDFEIDLKL
jgi:hypothetical protein